MTATCRPKWRWPGEYPHYITLWSKALQLHSYLYKKMIKIHPLIENFQHFSNRVCPSDFKFFRSNSNFFRKTGWCGQQSVLILQFNYIKPDNTFLSQNFRRRLFFNIFNAKIAKSQEMELLSGAFSFHRWSIHRWSIHCGSRCNAGRTILTEDLIITWNLWVGQ
jgi:hypothetical protein